MTRRSLHRHDNGVYATPVDVAVLRASYAGRRDVWRTLDLASVRDKSALLRAVALALDFPADFGHNWDALADALQDLSWIHCEHIVLEITGSDSLRRDAPEAWHTALDIFRGAATYWALHHRTLLVLVSGATDLPTLGP